MNRILMYHSIGTSQNGEVGARLYSVPLKNFEQQMEYIARLGTVPFKRLRNSYGGDSPCCIERDSPLITFDDGDITNYKYAYPILQLLELKAYFFILVSKVGSQGYMNWEQISELRDAGMIIGSHGMTHRILTELSDDELYDEVVKSRRFLEDNLMQSVDYFSVPRGFYNKKIIAMAKQAGYKAIFTSNPKDSDGFKFGRIPVKSSWDLEYFKEVINSGFSVKGRTEELIKNTSKKILGAKNYDRVRNIILTKD